MKNGESIRNDNKHKLLVILLPVTALLFLFILCFLLFRSCSRAGRRRRHSFNRTTSGEDLGAYPREHCGVSGGRRGGEELIRFQGGEDLTISDILDAPGEVIGKSSYGTLYQARLLPEGSSRESTVLLLRFLRPACCAAAEQVETAAREIGGIRGENLVPLSAVYVGPRGEKLLVYPFYGQGNLAQFIRDGDFGSQRWEIVYRIAHGIAKGLENLHTESQPPIIHGNLKSRNILLDERLTPYVSDYGLHLLLNPSSGQEMLDASASQGYKAPELMKIKHVCEATDIYSLGVILLELLTGKEPICLDRKGSEDPYLPNAVRSSILHHRISELYHPNLLVGRRGEGGDGQPVMVTEERVLKVVQLAIACCSPSPSFRPRVKEVVRKIEEIGKQQL